MKEERKWIRGALGRELRAGSHPRAQTKGYRAQEGAGTAAARGEKERRFLQLQRQPCSNLPSGGASEGAGELGVLGA